MYRRWKTLSKLLRLQLRRTRPFQLPWAIFNPRPRSPKAYRKKRNMAYPWQCCLANTWRFMACSFLTYRQGNNQVSSSFQVPSACRRGVFWGSSHDRCEQRAILHQASVCSECSGVRMMNAGVQGSCAVGVRACRVMDL